jgi:hypothetical protein
MNTFIFGLLAIISLFVFFKLGKIKASGKQLDREDRIKWGRNTHKNVHKGQNGSETLIEKPEQISDQSEK